MLNKLTGIESLKIKNFQAHESLTVELDPGVNTLVGPSDVGKSAVIRALRWLATNSPAGDQFIRWGEKEAVVGIKVDGHRIVRRKGKKNTYAIDDRMFIAFGNNIPDEVEALLRLTDANFQGQYDGPFWLGETAGEVARQLNQVVNLEIIDTTLSALASEVRGITAAKQVSEDRIQQCTDKVEEWKNARAMQSDFEKIEVMPGKICEQRDLIDTLSKLIEDTEEATERELHHWSCHESIKLVVAAGVDWHNSLDPLQGLTHLIQRFQSVEREADVGVPDAGVLVLLEQDARDLREVWGDIRGLAVAIQNYKGAGISHTGACASLIGVSSKLKKAIGEECPLCHQAIQ